MNLRNRYVLVGTLTAVVFVFMLTCLAACAQPAASTGLGKAVPADTVTVTATPTAAPAPSVPPNSGAGPYMGYNTWYEFDSAIDESRVLSEASLLVSDGLAAHGYTIVTLDGGWEAAQRNADGSMTWDPAKFPHGIPWLAATLNKMGLQLGIYTAIGASVCGSAPQAPGSFGHYQQDADTFRAWGVSFVKVDDCAGLPAGTTITQLEGYYKEFGADITGDEMIYSEELPVLQVPQTPAWLSAVQVSSAIANMWRVAPDLSWGQSENANLSSHLADDTHLHGYARAGHWNDLDMLVPGTVDSHPFGWTLSQAQAQLGIWSMEASPLFLSTNLADLTPQELAAVTNPDVIGLDQSGQQAASAYYEGPVTALVKPYQGGEAVLLYNAGMGGIAGFSASALTGWAHVSYRNVWTGSTGTATGISASLQTGQSALVILNKD